MAEWWLGPTTADWCGNPRKPYKLLRNVQTLHHYKAYQYEHKRLPKSGCFTLCERPKIRLHPAIHMPYSTAIFRSTSSIAS